MFNEPQATLLAVGVFLFLWCLLKFAILDTSRCEFLR